MPPPEFHAAPLAGKLMKLKSSDAIGFAAVLIAGFMAGRDSESQFTSTDIAIIALLLGFGFYLAVVLS